LTIEFERLDSLPLLSWCARVRPGGALTVRHGTRVETRRNGFVEGAWDGEFEAFDFDRAQTLAGTGGRQRGDVVVFAAPFHPLEWLFVLRRPDELLVSNSMVFLLSESGDTLDIRHPNYFFDLVALTRRGIAPPVTRLRMTAGTEVELYPCCNVEVGADLSLRRVPKPLGPPPECYADYFGFMLRTAQDVAANAAAPGRQWTYPFVAACSRGYDSTASAALVSQAGCREGVTFAQSGTAINHPLAGLKKLPVDDSGADSLRALGMNVTERDRADVLKLSGHPKAEFYIRPTSSTDVSMLLMEDKLRGSIFVSGRHGERYWGPTRRCKRENFRELDDCILSGHAYGEYRLRAGFLHYPAPYVGALHGSAIYRITHSEEMRPWKLGTGYYDRPIARRIAEEAGVRREYFGQRKMGSADSAQSLNSESERDFQDFLGAEVPVSIRRRMDPRMPVERLKSHHRLAYFRSHYSHLPLAAAALELLQTDRMHKLWNSVYLYIFHWGFEKIKNRYAVD
jgi:hypothetical protein